MKDVVHWGAAEKRTRSAADIGGTWTLLGEAASSARTGLNEIAIGACAEGRPPRCDSGEEEAPLVVLDAGGTLRLGSDDIAVRRGHVDARPPRTANAHSFVADASGLRMLARGARESNDITCCPRSNEVHFGGVRPMARLERLGFRHGED